MWPLAAFRNGRIKWTGKYALMKPNWDKRRLLEPGHFEDPASSYELATFLGSRQRAQFARRLVNAYHEKPTLERYLSFRQSFPEAEVEAGLFTSLEHPRDLEKDLKRHGIDRSLFEGALEGFAPAIDQLAMRLMALLVSKKKISKGTPGYIYARRKIDNRLINFLTAIMLEQTMWNGLLETAARVPPSLVVLIRHLLCGPAPDIRQALEAKEQERHLLTQVMIAIIKKKTLSVRKLAAEVGTNKNKVSDLLKKHDLKTLLGAVSNKA